MRPPVRDPLARRKNVLLRGEQDVIDAADRIGRASCRERVYSNV